MSHDMNAVPGGLRAYLTGYGRNNRQGPFAIAQCGA